MWVRQFHDSDLIPLHRMICDMIDASYSGVYPVRAVQFFKEYHSEKKIMERSQAGEVLIIERDGSIVATGALVGNEILGVFVKPDNQGQGYGKTIMSQLEHRAKAKGLSEVVLSVSLPSRKFYENLGYEVLAECSLDVGEGQHLDYWPARKTLTS
jgi:N-acetylglutamate synthase-like GNAT family acetyltransferase